MITATMSMQNIHIADKKADTLYLEGDVLIEALSPPIQVHSPEAIDLSMEDPISVEKRTPLTVSMKEQEVSEKQYVSVTEDYEEGGLKRGGTYDVFMLLCELGDLDPLSEMEVTHAFKIYILCVCVTKMNKCNRFETRFCGHW
jgi:hypothetical protein